MSTDTAIEQEIQAKGLTAPRVTPADIEANIASEHYFTAADGVAGAFTNAQWPTAEPRNYPGITPELPRQATHQGGFFHGAARYPPSPVRIS